MLTPAMVAAVLVAAAMHATWNAIAHAIADRLVGFALISVVYVVVGAAIVAVTGIPPAPVVPAPSDQTMVETGTDDDPLRRRKAGSPGTNGPVIRHRNGPRTWATSHVASGLSRLAHRPSGPCISD